MKPVLRICLALSLLGLAGCAPPSGQDSGEGTKPAGEGADRVELSETRTIPHPASYRRPPAWLVTGGEAVQADYGLYCESDVCYDPAGTEEDPATAEVAEEEKVFLAIGGDVDGEVSAGVVGYEDAPGGSAGPGVFTESGVPYYMREIEVRPVPKGEGPYFERVSDDEGVSVFELESTGNPGDRLLSIFVDKGDAQPTSYHLRLDPGEEGENPPPEKKEFPGTVTRVTVTPNTTTFTPEEAAQELPIRGLEKTSLGNSPRRIEAGEGYLWVLGSKEAPVPEPQPKGPDADGAASSAEYGSEILRAMAGPARDAVLLKVDPGTREVLSTIDVRAPVSSIGVGAGAVWLIDTDKGSVLRLDPRTEKVTQEVRVDGRPSKIAVTEDAVWIALFDDTQSGRVVNIDPETNEVAAEIETPGIAESIAVDGETGDVWAVSLDQTQGSINYEDNQLVRIDPEKNEISERLKVDGGVSDVAVGGGKVWVTNIHGGISKIDPKKGEIESVAELGRALGPNPHGGMEIVAGALWLLGPGGVTRLDPASGRASGSVKLGEYESEDLAVDGETGNVWVVDAGAPTTSGTLTRITP